MVMSDVGKRITDPLFKQLHLQADVTRFMTTLPNVIVP